MGYWVGVGGLLCLVFVGGGCEYVCTANDESERCRDARAEEEARDMSPGQNPADAEGNRCMDWEENDNDGVPIPNPLGDPLTSEIGSFTGVQLGDFNGDGHLDLAGFQSARVVATLGDGEGGFGPLHTIVEHRDFPANREVAVADFDGDGFDDIVASGFAHSGAMMEKLGVVFGGPTGFGSFEVVDSGGYPSEFGRVTTGDFNGDGRPDVAACVPRCMWVIGRGDREFEFEAMIGVLPVAPCLTTADVDGDGRDEIVTDPGPFQDWGYASYPHGYEGSFSSFVDRHEGCRQSADLDRNGRLDALFLDGYSVFVSFQDTDRSLETFGYCTRLESDRQDIANLTFPEQDLDTGDFNADGEPDIVAIQDPLTLAVLAGQADDPDMLMPTEIQTEVRGFSELMVADFNEDGVDDVLVLHTGPHGVSVLPGGAR